ncbi:hypothetical protein BDV59DRAFT_200513 [Aspergillus ambiguus]|uniref:alpha/beta hydrolase n=1 Tax=Aspergillus ambiguus TaxID=176160 RepID=UPI003CCE3ACE
MVTAQNAVFDNLTTPETNIEATDFALGASTQGFNGTLQALTGYSPVTGRYWDLAFNDYNYSYVENVLAHGYHTLSYDRLGIGNSSHGEPKNEIQTRLEVAALAQMTRMVRNGSFPGIPQPKSIIHVGHSFGSVQTYDLTAIYPDISDGIVLTGFSLNLSFFGYFLAGGNWQQTHITQRSIVTTNYTPGYLSNGNMDADQYLFCRSPWFDSNILVYNAKIKQPVTVGELLTIGTVPAQSTFPGPVLIITGSNDLPFCGGDCYNTGGASDSIPADARSSFTARKSILAYVQPDMGHGINLHYNASGAYNFIVSWLMSNGLAP